MHITWNPSDFTVGEKKNPLFQLDVFHVFKENCNRMVSQLTSYMSRLLLRFHDDPWGGKKSSSLSSVNVITQLLSLRKQVFHERCSGLEVWKPHKPRLHAGNMTFDLFLCHQHVLSVTWKNVWYILFTYGMLRVFSDQHNLWIKWTLKILVTGWTTPQRTVMHSL